MKFSRFATAKVDRQTNNIKKQRHKLINLQSSLCKIFQICDFLNNKGA